MQDYFGVTRGLKDRAFALKVAPQFGGIRDVSVVRDGNLAFIAGHRKRLRIQQHGVAGSGVARVPDRQLAWQVRSRRSA